ncbi:transmembrane protein, putative (macronuclear) [Tetrahymena thermophila SB210]|uniref:Transmembrane protein, putative n=1 Tax=Tetrahymena thermophila (strain SB210) TaxID=312017 RepID=W7XKD4_TETTS|nr:transmembrane protein, putative [Tetrahymena thermophila SB210]EWS74804.1 transmembrane protein, putative [Tetrahymena thermophila SB210]|eukprot:XP_012652697.1 transmembrane protein, putative [Tetrahymena thermophila SB210]
MTLKLADFINSQLSLYLESQINQIQKNTVLRIESMIVSKKKILLRQLVCRLLGIYQYLMMTKLFRQFFSFMLEFLYSLHPFLFVLINLIYYIKQ